MYLSTYWTIIYSYDIFPMDSLTVIFMMVKKGINKKVNV